MAETGGSEKEKKWDRIILQVKSFIREIELGAILVLLIVVVCRIFKQIGLSGNKFAVDPKNLLPSQFQTALLWTGIIEIIGVLALILLAGLLLLAFVKIRRED